MREIHPAPADQASTLLLLQRYTYMNKTQLKEFYIVVTTAHQSLLPCSQEPGNVKIALLDSVGVGGKAEEEEKHTALRCVCACESV